MSDHHHHDSVRPIRWLGDRMELLDQRLLPQRSDQVVCRNADETATAIRQLVVRGAPAIGIAAAYGLVLESAGIDAATGPQALAALGPAIERLRAARPTAVNLAWALARLQHTLEASGADWRERLRTDAEAIASEDLDANRRMGELGAALIAPGSGVLTHCNTGSLATAGYGTALGVIRSGWSDGRVTRVFADETRPWLQGSRLTVWELQQDQIPATLIADAAASHLMLQGQVQWVVVGADRIAANGDVANKIGTYQLAIAARHHGLRFMVVAPSSTVDMATPDGAAIEIEQRPGEELMSVAGQRMVAEGIDAWNPVFDVTPASLIDAIVTERGVVERPDRERMVALFGEPG